MPRIRKSCNLKEVRQISVLLFYAWHPSFTSYVQRTAPIKQKETNPLLLGNPRLPVPRIRTFHGHVNELLMHAEWKMNDNFDSICMFFWHIWEIETRSWDWDAILRSRGEWIVLNEIFFMDLINHENHFNRLLVVFHQVHMMECSNPLATSKIVCFFIIR